METGAKPGSETMHCTVLPTETTERLTEPGVKKEIFEKVPDEEAITWCSPLVVQPKPQRNEKDDIIDRRDAENKQLKMKQQREG